MSRELKFRGWDPEKMEIFYYGMLTANNGRLVVVGGEDKMPIMQYTGLKDKNGVEIFEGDVIRLPKGDRCAECCCKFDVETDTYKSEVFYSSQARYSINNHGNNSDVEVIGNIYENPELLT